MFFRTWKTLFLCPESNASRWVPAVAAASSAKRCHEGTRGSSHSFALYHLPQHYPALALMPLLWCPSWCPPPPHLTASSTG